MIDPTGIRARFTLLLPHLDERRRRLFAATEARTAGYGGIAAVSRATGIAVSTIGRGLKELATAARLDADRVRRPGGGRKAEGASRWWRRTRPGWTTCWHWWRRASGAIRCRRCAGPARACGGWRGTWRRVATGSATRLSANF